MDYFFEATTPYSPEVLRAYNRFHNTKVRWVWPAIILAAGILLFVAGVLLTFLAGEIIFEVVLVSIMGAVFIGLWLRMWLGKGMAKRNPSPFGIITNRYRFCADRLEYANQQNQGFVTYDQILTVYETWNYFFIYIAKTQAFVLHKSGFTLGDAAGLHQFLTTGMGWKFKIIGWKG